jgi:hypothetical protein
MDLEDYDASSTVMKGFTCFGHCYLTFNLLAAREISEQWLICGLKIINDFTSSFLERKM